MIIALDFDQTVTEDRKLWKLFAITARQRGHKVYIVTYRRDDGDNSDIEVFAREAAVEGIVCTAGKQKSHVFTADVWIDDQPVTIPCYEALQQMAHGCEVNRDTEAVNV